MNLKPFVNKNVIVQLKAPWIACEDSDQAGHSDRPIPMTRTGTDGQAGIVSMPYIEGRILEREGGYVIKYTANKRCLETMITPDGIFAVTCMSEDRILGV